MSSVRMCDRCGEVFSERADGWSTYSGSINKRDPDTGRVQTRNEQLDACVDCTELMTGTGAAAPRPLTPGGAQHRYELPRAAAAPAPAAGVVQARAEPA